MEIVPSIICTLDKETDLVIKDVFELLPSEIKEFHRYISLMDDGSNLNELLTDAIKYIQADRKNSKHSARHHSTGAFYCNLFMLFNKTDKNKINNVSNIFKERFNEGVKGGDYNETLFNLSEQDISSLQKNYYQICNHDSHGTRIENDKLFEKLKYFFLFILTSDLYESGKIADTNNAFFISPMAPQKYFKSIAIEVDGLPIFSLRNYYFEALKEKYLRELLEDKNELNDETALNKLKTVSSLEVENFKSPEKPKDPLELSFFSTKKGRKKILEDAIVNAADNFKKYETLSKNIANQQRIDLETEVYNKKPNEIKIFISEIVSSSKSITELIKLFWKLLDKNGKIFEFLKSKEIEICWPEVFRFSREQFTSNHPNWLIFSILGAFFILPEFVDYIFYFPTEYMIKWNVLFGLIWGGYTLYSVFDIRRVRSKFNEYYFDNLLKVEDYFSVAFTAFKKYLEIHIIKVFLRKINTTNEVLIKNQAFLVAYYLTLFKSGDHYQIIKKIYLKFLNSNSIYSGLFIERLNQELIRIINKREDLKEELSKISEGNNPFILAKELVNLIENDKIKTRLISLTEKLKSFEIGEKVIDVIQNEVDKCSFTFDSNLFVEKMSLNQLNDQINDFISNQNFDNLLSEIKQKLEFTVKESVEKLLNQDHTMYYLTPSQDKPEEKKMVFIPEKLNRDDIIEYVHELKVICGYLKVGDFKIKNAAEVKS